MSESNSTVKIEQKIVGYKIKKDAAKPQQVKEVVHVEKPLLQRGEVLDGQTYKIKTPASEHAFYITINDAIIEDDGVKKRVPFEVFINTKNMEHFMWIVALTRVVSAIFRKGGDVTFLVEELKAVFDPRGGYYKKGGKYITSLVAEIGMVIEEHLTNIGAAKEKDESTVKFIEKKKEEFMKQNGEGGDQFKNASICDKCGDKAVVLMDNCMTCLECGAAKCG